MIRWAPPQALRPAGPPSPRVEPVPADEVSGDVQEVLSRFPPGAPTTVFRTLAHHPVLLRKWTVFGDYVLDQSLVPERDRELVILRVAWRCGSSYVFSAHVPIALRAGATELELAHVQDVPGTARAGDYEAMLLRAADELCTDSTLSDDVWAQLAEQYTLQQILDLIFTVGQYRLVSALTNALRISPEGVSPEAQELRPGG